MPAVQAGDRPLKMKLPDTYEGDRSALQDWLDQIALYQFGNMQGAPESRKIAFTLSLLRGNALKWARPILAGLNGPAPLVRTHEALVTQLTAAFSEVDAPAIAGDKLLGLKQGSGSVADYAAKFRKYKSLTGWGQDNAAYISIFCKGLTSTVLQHIAGKEPEGAAFDDYVNWVTSTNQYFIQKCDNYRILSYSLSTIRYSHGQGLWRALMPLGGASAAPAAPWASPNKAKFNKILLFQW